MLMLDYFSCRWNHPAPKLRVSNLERMTAMDVGCWGRHVNSRYFLVGKIESLVREDYLLTDEDLRC